MSILISLQGSLKAKLESRMFTPSISRLAWQL